MSTATPLNHSDDAAIPPQRPARKKSLMRTNNLRILKYITTAVSLFGSLASIIVLAVVMFCITMIIGTLSIVLGLI